MQAADDVLPAVLQPALAQPTSDAFQHERRFVHMHFLAWNHSQADAAAAAASDAPEQNGLLQLAVAAKMHCGPEAAAVAWQKGMAHSTRLKGLDCLPWSIPLYHTDLAPDTIATSHPAV